MERGIVREVAPAARTAPRSRRSDALLAGLVIAVTFGSLAAAIPLGTPIGTELPADLWTLVVAGVTSSMGVVVVLRRPGNVVGRLLCVTGIAWGSLIVTASYAAPATVGIIRPGSAVVGWVASWVWMPLFVTVLFLLPLLFPDGRLPSPRWRSAVRIGLGGALLVLVATMITPGQIDLGDRLLPLDNPFGVEGAAPLLRVLTVPAGVLVLGLPTIGVAAMLVRYRRADPVTRRQLKWVLFAISLVVAILAVGQIVEPLLDLLMPLPFAFVPAAVGIAVLRHGLYDIDRLISRTLSYALLTGMLGALYVGGVFALQQVLQPISGDSGWATAGATLAVAALFQPTRRRIQTMVDRRFNRLRYDRERTVAAFRARLRREVNLEALGADLIDTIQATMDPAGVSLWLRPRGQRNRVVLSGRASAQRGATATSSWSDHAGSAGSAACSSAR